jgi:hypothetical protein
MPLRGNGRLRESDRRGAYMKRKASIEIRSSPPRLKVSGVRTGGTIDVAGGSGAGTRVPRAVYFATITPQRWHSTESGCS